MTYWEGESLTAAKFILQNKGMLSHEENHIIVSRMKNITINIISLFL